MVIVIMESWSQDEWTDFLLAIKLHDWDLLKFVATLLAK